MAIIILQTIVHLHINECVTVRFRLIRVGAASFCEFHVKHRLVTYVSRCYVKYRDLFWETGDRQLFHIQISAFQNRVWEIIHKSMVVYLISNITVDTFHLFSIVDSTMTFSFPHLYCA